MNKGFFALLMLAVLLLPMYAGLQRIRRLPPRRADEPMDDRTGEDRREDEAGTS